MTDEQIVEAMKEASGLLARYHEVMKPVAVAIAARATAEKGYAHTGSLGGYDCGIETLCIEGDDQTYFALMERHPDYDDPKNPVTHTMRIIDHWNKVKADNGIRGIHVSVLF